MASSLSRSEITLKSAHTKGNQSSSTQGRPLRHGSMLPNFQDAFIFVIWAETEYIFASEDVSMPKGDPSEDEPAPFSSPSCSLTQQSLFMLRAPFSLNYFDVFSCYFVFFSIFSIKMPPILVNTSPQSCSKSIPAVNNS